jgi:hypothetical protein
VSFAGAWGVNIGGQWVNEGGEDIGNVGKKAFVNNDILI